MIEENINFRSGSCTIQGSLIYPGGRQLNGYALLCPPHPLLGGDEKNNVMQELYDRLGRLNLAVLRFNYGGVGGSETELNMSEQEKIFWQTQSCPEYESQIIRDASSAYNYFKASFETGKKIILVGYSFGCYPALQIAKKETVSDLILISPPLSRWKIQSDYLDIKCSKSLIYTSGDFACSEADMIGLYNGFAGPKKLHTLNCQNHFYIGEESTLADTVEVSLNLI